MAYRIQYGKPGKREKLETIRNSKKYKVVKYVIIGVVLFALLLLGKTGKFYFLIPGDKEVTQKAFYAMVEDVKGGEGVKNAITTFCEEILTSAQSEN